MNLDPDRLDGIFAEALTFADETERRAYLDRECGDNEALRQEVESLLRAHEQAGDFLGNSAPLPMKAETEVESGGTRIGRYKLLEKIGEGGFGVVWMAEQEEPVRRRVALKIIKLGMDTREVVARFEAERQALAMMDHPNIASVFDGGATTTGRPYFVMEVVKGIPLTEYCDANTLSTEERLNLFMQVCHAVQHAHQKGVIHRDLKPSNILVTVKDDRPVPKVIDFGVAKATQSRLTEKTLFTKFRQWVGTPAYMSPEQAGLGSLDVDARSDIYSLGVLLYELLTGRTPFDTKNLLEQGYDAVMRTIRVEEPPKPSTRLSTLAEEELSVVAARRQADPVKLNRLVRGDLDWIVMKALEKDRTRRYETAGALASDLVRHLNNEPVIAAAPSPLYRLLKFARRHRTSLIASGAFITLLVVGTALSLWQAVRASRLAHQESRQRMRAEGLAVQIQTNLDATRLNLYAADIALANRAVEEGNLLRARTLLEGWRPKSGETDLRGVEWRYLWTLSSGDQIATLRAPTNVDGRMECLAVSPDGKLAAAGCSGGTILLWDLTTFALVGSIAGHTNACKDLVFSPDGRVLASCSTGENRVRLWEVSSRSVRKEISVGTPARLAFSPDGALLALGTRGEPQSETGRTFLFDAHTGNQLRELPESGGNCLAFSPDGQCLATGIWQQLVKVWDVASVKLVRSFPVGRCLTLDFSPDFTTVAGTDWSDLRLWSLATGTRMGALTNGPWMVGKIVFSGDGSRVAAATGLGTIALWNRRTSEPLGFLKGHEAEVSGLCFIPNRELIASVSRDRTLRIWRRDTESVKTRSVRTWADRCWYLPQWPISTDGKHLAIRWGNTVRILNAEMGRQESLWQMPAYPLGFAGPNNFLIALSGAWDLEAHNILNPVRPPVPQGAKSLGAIEFWDWQAKTNWRVSLRHLSVSTCMAAALSPAGDFLALNLASTDPKRPREVVVVGTQTGEVESTLSPPSSSSGALAFSPDGNRLFVHAFPNWLWQWRSTNPPIEFPKGRLDLCRAAFSPDGRHLALNMWEVDATVWDIASGERVAALSMPYSQLWYANFSANGSTLALGFGLSGNARLWHIPSQRELLTLPPARAIQFSPDEGMMAMIGIHEISFTRLFTLAEADAPVETDPDVLAAACREQVTREERRMAAGPNRALP